MRISVKIPLGILISLLCVCGILIYLGSSAMREIQNTTYLKTKDIVKQNVVTTGKSVVNTIHDSMDKVYSDLSSYNSDEMILRHIKAYIDNIKLSSKDVKVYSFNSKGTYINHYAKQYEGTNAFGDVDINGINYMKELAKKAANGGGHMDVVIPWDNNTLRTIITYAVKDTHLDIIYGCTIDLDGVFENLAKENKDIDENIEDNILHFSMYAIIVGVIVLAGFVVFVRTQISRPLNNLTAKSIELSSGDGDLTKKLEVRGNDEIAQASHAINDFLEKVRVLIAEAKDISSENANIANELSQNSLQTGKRVAESSSIVGSVAVKGSEAKELLDTGVVAANKGKEELSSAMQFVDEATKTINSLSDQITHSADIESEMANRIERLSADADNVKSILEIINDVAATSVKNAGNGLQT